MVLSTNNSEEFKAVPPVTLAYHKMLVPVIEISFNVAFSTSQKVCGEVAVGSVVY